MGLLPDIYHTHKSRGLVSMDSSWDSGGAARYYLDNFFSAIEKGNLHDVRDHIEKRNIDVNILDRNGNSPIYWACLCEQPDILKYLLDQGAEYDSYSPLGERCSLATNNKYILKLLHMRDRSLAANFKESVGSESVNSGSDSSSDSDSCPEDGTFDRREKETMRNGAKGRAKPGGTRSRQMSLGNYFTTSFNQGEKSTSNKDKYHTSSQRHIFSRDLRRGTLKKDHPYSKETAQKHPYTNENTETGSEESWNSEEADDAERKISEEKDGSAGARTATYHFKVNQPQSSREGLERDKLYTLYDSYLQALSFSQGTGAHVYVHTDDMNGARRSGSKSCTII